MKVEFWVIGKTNTTYLEDGTAIYEKRLKHYLPFEYQVIRDIRQSGKLSADQLKKKEGEAIQKLLKTDDYLVLLDEKGKHFTSVAFAAHLDQLLQFPKKRLIFLVGGAYGFDEQVYQRSDAKLALSKMTFSHQMIRLFFLEQLYRGMTILRNEPYHNQ
jgi:23S rRNA (pseudouridine1915-N3)-methyltransferase